MIRVFLVFLLEKSEELIECGIRNMKSLENTVFSEGVSSNCQNRLVTAKVTHEKHIEIPVFSYLF